jgi:parallel beta-helix repeat protein
MLRKSMLTKGFVSIVLIIILCGSSAYSVSTTSISYQNTIYVDDDNTEGPWDGSQEYPFRYIQDAIDLASNGDTVFVYSGFYTEHIHVKKSVNLIGEDKNSTVIDGSKSGDVIYLTGNESQISGFTIQECGRCLFSDCACIDVRSWGNTIHSNIIRNSDNIQEEHGIYVHVLQSNNLIKNNIFEGNCYGVRLQFSSDTFLKNNSFTNNYWGMQFEFTEHVNITGNTITNSSTAIRVWDSYNCLFEHNTITSYGGGGIVLIDSSSNIIRQNTIKNHGYGYWAGISLGSSANNNAVTNNVIDNFETGIGLVNNQGNLISSNTISNNQAYGICLEYENYENEIILNNFINNTIHAKTSGKNQWDNGWKGNYWDDYKEKYPDANEKLRGVWNTPYEISSTQIDKYPLVNPHKTSENKVLRTNIQIILGTRLNLLLSILNQSTMKNDKKTTFHFINV